jgi:hypothetical protein
VRQRRVSSLPRARAPEEICDFWGWLPEKERPRVPPSTQVPTSRPGSGSPGPLPPMLPRAKPIAITSFRGGRNFSPAAAGGSLRGNPISQFHWEGPLGRHDDRRRGEALQAVRHAGQPRSSYVPSALRAEEADVSSPAPQVVRAQIESARPSPWTLYGCATGKVSLRSPRCRSGRSVAAQCPPSAVVRRGCGASPAEGADVARRIFVRVIAAFLQAGLSAPLVRPDLRSGR